MTLSLPNKMVVAEVGARDGFQSAQEVFMTSDRT